MRWMRHSQGHLWLTTCSKARQRNRERGRRGSPPPRGTPNSGKQAVSRLLRPDRGADGGKRKDDPQHHRGQHHHGNVGEPAAALERAAHFIALKPRRPQLNDGQRGKRCSKMPGAGSPARTGRKGSCVRLQCEISHMSCHALQPQATHDLVRRSNRRRITTVILENQALLNRAMALRSIAAQVSLSRPSRSRNICSSLISSCWIL